MAITTGSRPAPRAHCPSDATSCAHASGRSCVVIVQTGAPYTIYNSPVDLEAAGFFSDVNVIPGRVSGALCDTLDVYNRTPVEVSHNVWDCYWEGSTLRAVTAASIETLDAFCADRASVPDFIKCDVEGAELGEEL